MDEITKLIIRNGKRLRMICSKKYDLSVENPLRKLLLNEKSITLDQVLDTLEEFRNHYKTGEGSLFTLKDNLELIEAAIKKKIHSKLDKNSELDINKETVTILKLSHIKTWLDVYKENLRLNPIDWLKNDEQFKNINAAGNYYSPHFTDNLNFLNALNLDINNHPDLNEDKKKIFHQVINEASIALLNHFQDEDYHKITINHLPIAKILFSLLEKNQDNTPSKESIINQLNKIESLLFKLRILDITYDKIVNNTNLKSEYIPQQLNIIATLQEVYKELIKNEPFDENNKRFNESLTNAVNNSPLTRFVSSKLNPSTFFGQDARSALNSSLEGLIKGEQRPKAQFGNRESENMDGADQKSPTLREEGSTALKQIYHIHSNYNWIEYDRKNLEIPAKDWGYDNWKLNLSIHKDDLDKAFATMADIASKYHLGAFKRMSNEQASSPGANMVGRQIAVYYDANPELDSDAWLTIISEIEDELKKQGIRLSTLPISNRRIGLYTSYTHEAWVNDSKIGQVVTFGEGIKETALEDEDPLSKFYYDEYGESIAKKEESSLSPMSC